MISVAGALAALVVFRGTTVHIVVGLGFFALVLVHVAQRRRTAGRLVAHLGHARQWASRPGRRALSDVLLGLLTLNLLVSGLADWLAGHTILLPVAALGWHVAAAVALLADASVHVLRRRRRLRTSHIR
jgi:CBS domain containing-hemolysin-like protein